MRLETGDIILGSKRNIIVYFMKLFQKDPVFWGHCFVVKDADTAWEANWRLREISITDALDQKHYKIIRKIDLTEEQKEIMRQEAPKLLGQYYGVGRIFLQLLNNLFFTTWFTDRNENEKMQVCSSYAAWIYDKACNYKFNGKHWESCDPDDIDDDSLNFPDLWITLNERESKARFLRK